MNNTEMRFAEIIKQGYMKRMEQYKNQEWSKLGYKPLEPKTNDKEIIAHILKGRKSQGFFFTAERDKAIDNLDDFKAITIYVSQYAPYKSYYRIARPFEEKIVKELITEIK